MITFKALRAGARTTNQSYRLVILLYAVNLLIAAILAWGFHSVLANTIGDSINLEHLIKVFDFTIYADFMFKYGGRIATLLSQIWWLILFYLLLNALLDGGTIAILKKSEEQFSLQRFFGECGKFFFRFFRLFLIFGAMVFIVGFITFAVFGFVYSAFTSGVVSEVWPFTLAIILFLLFLFIVMLVVMMADYAKVGTVSSGTKSMFKMSWQGIKFVIRHSLATVGLQLSIFFLLLVGIIVYLLLENQIGMTTPLTVFAMFVVQQVSVGFKVWTRVLTFASELNLYGELTGQAEQAQSAALSTRTPAEIVPPATSELQAAPPVLPARATRLQPERKRPAAKRTAARKAPARTKKARRKTR